MKILYPSLLLSLLYLSIFSSPLGCSKYDPSSKSCSSCLKGYYLKSAQCIPCFPSCKQCQFKNNVYQCLQCQQNYYKYDPSNCYLCSEKVTVDGKQECKEWIIPGDQKSSVNTATVVFIGVLAIVIVCVSTKIYSKYSQQNRKSKEEGGGSVSKEYIKEFEEKTEDIETNVNTSHNDSKQQENVIQSPQSHQQIIDPPLTSTQLKSSITLLPSPSTPKQHPSHQSNPQSNIKLSKTSSSQSDPPLPFSSNQPKLQTSVSLDPQHDICYYCKQLHIECQTQCLIDCHIECQIQQYKNLHQCFRCKSNEFHSFGKCEECKEYRVRLILCGNQCGEEEHINCYGMLNYEEYCEGCKKKMEEREENKENQREKDRQRQKEREKEKEKEKKE